MLTFSQALNRGLRSSFESDPTVMVMREESAVSAARCA